MRRAIILALILISLIGADYKNMKRRLRWLAVAIGRTSLRLVSQPYTEKNGTALVFAPHQDDETLGCGGLIARKRSLGLPVHVAFITDGSASHPNHPLHSAREIVTMRTAEARAALQHLGVESCAIHFLEAPDGELPHLSEPARAELVRRISILLQEVRPDEVFLACSPDGSTEHEAAFDIVLQAMAALERQPEVWQYPIWSWWNPLLLIRHLAVLGPCRHQRAEDFLRPKLLAIDAYQSQIKPLKPDKRPSIPPELLNVFHSDHEFFFRSGRTSRHKS